MNYLFDIDETSTAPEDTASSKKTAKRSKAKPKFAKRVIGKEASIDQLRELADGDDPIVAKEAKALLAKRLKSPTVSDRPFDPSDYVYWQDIVGDGDG